MDCSTLKVVQIGSLFYGAIVDGENVTIITIGYPTYEMCMSISGIDDI